jgi:hypothetical protein
VSGDTDYTFSNTNNILMDYYSKFLELYQSANFPIELAEDSETGEKTITLTVKRGTVEDKVQGYSGFCTVLCFDKDGQFISQEIWE